MSGLLGHTNISTTLRYAMATDPMKVSAIGAIPGLEWEAVGSKFRVKYAKTGNSLSCWNPCIKKL